MMLVNMVSTFQAAYCWGTVGSLKTRLGQGSAKWRNSVSMGMRD